MAWAVDKVVADFKKIYEVYQEESKKVTSVNSDKFHKKMKEKYRFVWGNCGGELYLCKIYEIDDVFKVENVYERTEEGFLRLEKKIAVFSLKHRSGATAVCDSHKVKFAYALERGEEVRITGIAFVKYYYQKFLVNSEIERFSVEFREYPKITRLK